MKIAGIVAEYNPFHNGHKYHIEKTKEATGADAVVAVYGCKGSSVDPEEALTNGITGSETAYGPNIIAGVEAEVDTVLVLSGVTKKEDIAHFAYTPKYVMTGLAELVEKLS